MSKMIPAVEIGHILAAHDKWLRGEAGALPADLIEADLSGADLSGANLRSADLSYANLNEADLSGVNLRGANLSGADLRGANLSGADLRGANLSEADLSEADLSGASLSEADLRSADLSRVTGLLNPIEYLENHFERDPDGRGLIAYKVFGLCQPPPLDWKLEAGAILTEVVLHDRCCDCGCGINVATLGWIRHNSRGHNVWRVLIRWAWLAGVVVPYQTDGKIRCGRVELLGIVGQKEAMNERTESDL